METTIKVNRTFAIITEESAENGDYDSTGFLAEDEEISFRDLVNMMKGGQASCYPVQADITTWVEYSQDTDMYSGDTTIETVHFASNEGSEWAERFWCRALKFAFYDKMRSSRFNLQK